MRYLFIVNPHAHSQLGKRVWNRIEGLLRSGQIDFTVHFTKYQGHATKLVRESLSDGKEHTIVAVGGDGTVNEVINGISDFGQVTFGYIPTGSGNDFARDLQLPTTPQEALEVILEARRIRFVDVGILNYQEQTRRFAVSAGMGFDAAVCRQAVVSVWKRLLNRIGLGKLTYAGIAVNRLLVDDTFPVTIQMEQETVSFPNCYFVAIMNRRYEGGGCQLCPAASDHDGELDIIVIEGVSRLKLLCCLPTTFFGGHTHFKGVHLYRTKQAQIIGEKRLPVHVDGEPISPQEQIQACCEKESLRIIVK